MSGAPLQRSVAGGPAEVAPEAEPSGSPATDWGLVAVLGLHFVVAFLVFEPILFPGADVGQYIVLGEALREGRGFRDIHLPGSPLHAKFPPGYPLALAMAGWFGGLQLFKALSLACTTATVWLAYRIGRRHLDRPAALVAVALLAACPVLLDFSHRVLSEALFTFLLLAAVLEASEERRWGVAAALAAGASFFTRTAGLPILLGVAAHATLDRNRRRALVAWAVLVVCVGGWALYQRWAQPAQPGYLHQLVLANPYDPSAGRISLVEFPVRVARNLWQYVASEYPGSFGLPTRRMATQPLTGAMGVLLSSLALAGWLWTATRRLTVAHFVTFLYVGMIVVWPPVWTDRRFLLPILPLLLVWTVAGVKALAVTWRPWAAYVAGGLIVGTLGACEVTSAVRVVPERLACQASYRSGSPCDRANYAEFYEMARWASDNTPPTAIIANRSPATFFLFSGRQGDVYPYSRDPDVVLGGLEEMGAEFVVLDRLSATTQMYLLPAVAEHVERFQVMHVVGGEGGTALLRLLPASRTAMVPLRP